MQSAERISPSLSIYNPEKHSSNRFREGFAIFKGFDCGVVVALSRQFHCLIVYNFGRVSFVIILVRGFIFISRSVTPSVIMAEVASKPVRGKLRHELELMIFKIYPWNVQNYLPHHKPDASV